MTNQQLYQLYVNAIYEFFDQTLDVDTWLRENGPVLQEPKSDISQLKRQIVEYEFSHGGCYWFAWKLSSMIPDTRLLYHPEKRHCGLLIDETLYDFFGRINRDGFRDPVGKEHMYLYEHYKPRFPTKELSIYIEEKGPH